MSLTVWWSFITYIEVVRLCCKMKTLHCGACTAVCLVLCKAIYTSPPGCVWKALSLIWSPFSLHYAGPLGRPQQIRTISTPVTSSLKLLWHSLHPTCHTYTPVYWPETTHEHTLLSICKHSNMSRLSFSTILQRIHFCKMDIESETHKQTHSCLENDKCQF